MVVSSDNKTNNVAPATKPTTVSNTPVTKKDNNNNKKSNNNKNNNKKPNNNNKKPQQQQQPTKSEKSMNTFSNKFFKNDKDKKEQKDNNNNNKPNNNNKKSFKKDNNNNNKSNKNEKDNKPKLIENKKNEKEINKKVEELESDEIKIEKPNNDAKNPTFTKAQQLYNKKVEEYIQDFNKNGSRDDQWKDKIQHTGTIRDRISAITLLVQKAPMYRLQSLDILLNLAAKKSERERDFAVNSLKDLFVNSLLPNSKLKRFNERENLENCKPMELVQYFFEDLLKSRYQAFIRLLEVLSRDTVARIRMISTATIQYLLLKKPEQEEVLLTLLVNKIGDDEGSNASKVVKLLEKLIEAHPSMKLVVIREIELFLYRPNNAPKAQYNALYFLNKVQVQSEKDGTSQSEIKEISHRLITLYFTFFSNKSNINSSAISLLIFGIRKAYSYTKDTTNFDPVQIKTLFKSCRKNTINKVIQTLSLLFEIKQHTPEISNQFYLNLYHTLNRFEKLSQFDQTSFLNLIFRAIKHDEDINRAKSIIKRLLQFSFNQIVSFSASTLILLSEIIKFNSEFSSLINKNNQPVVESKEGKEEEEEENKVPMYDSLHHDPVDANGQLSCVWELNLYSIHQHPTISTFAKDLLEEKSIKFQGNPTTLFTLSAFLEKFALSRPKNRKGPQSTLLVTKSKIGQDYYNAKPDEQFLNTYGDITIDSGVQTKKKSSSASAQFITDEKELDQVLGYKTDERDGEDDDEIVDSDLDAEYSYSDLEDEDFEDEDIESEIPKLNKKLLNKQKQQEVNEEDDGDEDFDINDEEFESLTKGDLLGDIPDDLDELDEEEDQDEEDEDDDDEVEEEDEDVDLDDEDVQIPDFGDEDEEEIEDVDGTIAPDFGDEEEEDEENEDKEESAFIKSMKNNDSFMDADEFAAMLENSGGNNNKKNDKNSYKKSKPTSKQNNKKNTPTKSSQKKPQNNNNKRKRF